MTVVGRALRAWRSTDRTARPWGGVRPTGTYTDWLWPARRGGYEAFEWDVTVRTDPSPDGYFWSHQVGFAGGGTAYFGIQTRGTEPRGRIAVFSVWEALEARGPDYAEPFGTEGHGFTVRIPFDWRAGVAYRLRLEEAGDGWWAASAGEAGGGPAERVGEILVPPGWGGLAPSSVMWTERYLGPLRTCADIRHAVARFSAPEAPGGVRPVSHRNHLYHPPACPGSRVWDEGEGVVQEMGGPPQ